MLLLSVTAISASAAMCAIGAPAASDTPVTVVRRSTMQDEWWSVGVHLVHLEPTDPRPAGSMTSSGTCTQASTWFWLPIRPVRRSVVGN